MKIKVGDLTLEMAQKICNSYEKCDECVLLCGNVCLKDCPGNVLDLDASIDISLNEN